MDANVQPSLPARVVGGSFSGFFFRSNLAFALWSLPRQARRDMMVFYRFCRIVDDIADDPEKSEERKREELRPWFQAAEGKRDFPEDLAEVIQRKGVPSDLILAILEGVASDISLRRFADFEELRGYCWKVAVAVGLASNRITGCVSAAADLYAERLGLALQLTNILRDVREDAVMGRVYLPVDMMIARGLAEEKLLEEVEKLSFVLADLGEIAEGYFRAAETAFEAVEDRRGLRAAEVMREIYFRLFLKMKRDGYRVLERRYRVSRLWKFWVVAKGLKRKLKLES